MGIVISSLPPSPDDVTGHEIPSMKEGVTQKVTGQKIANIAIGGASEGFNTLAKAEAEIVALQDGKADLDLVDTHSLVSKPAPVDADEFRVADSAASWGFKRLSWANLKTSLINALRPYINLGTLTASTSGTSIDFTSIPAGVKRVNIMFNGVSTNGTDPPMIQIGDSGGVETSGYAGGYVNISTTAAAANSVTTSGFALGTPSAATATFQGKISLDLMDPATNLWAMSSNLADNTGSRFHTAAGTKALSATLDRIRVTTTGGTNTFDAGSLNVSWEF